MSALLRKFSKHHKPRTPMKKTKKNATPHAVIATEQGLEAAVHRYVDVSLSLLRRKAKQARVLAALQAEHAAANASEESEVLGLESGIQLFAETHRALVLPDETKLKSRDFGSAVIGFRLNPPSVGKVLPKDTWDNIVSRLENLEWAEPFVTYKAAANKDALLLARGDLTAAQLAQAGIRYEQGETFYIEPATALLEAARKPVSDAEAAA